MSGIRAVFLAGIGLLLLRTGLVFGADDAEAGDRLTYIAPLPEMAAFAAANEIPMEGVLLAGEGEDARPGDQVVLLVTLFEDKEYSQWLVSLKTEELTDSDREKKPPKDTVVYTITGQTLRYPSVWAPVGIRIVGPYEGVKDKLDSNQRLGSQPFHPGQDKVKDKHSRTLVHEAFLSVGFDRWCELVLRKFPTIDGDVRVAPGHIETGRVLSWAGKPFTDDQTMEGRRLAGLVGITPADERLVAGEAPALSAFLHIAAKTPGSDEILLQILKIPSLWSIIRQGLDFRIKLQSGQLSMVDPGKWKLPMPVYRMPLVLRINGEDALDCTLAVANPRPPLRTCAGILGISASNPAKVGTSLSIRVIATRRGPSS